MNTREIAQHLAKAARKFPYLGIDSAGQLLEVLRRELGSEAALDSWQPYGAALVKAVAPKSILHILSRNTPAAGLQSLLRGLLIGTPENRCKIPGTGLPEIEQFRSLLPAELAERVQISPELQPGWLETSEAVIVFGSDETIEHFRQIAPSAARFIGYGHKVSIGIIFESAGPDVAAAAARDVAIFDQQGCLSPHVFYVRKDQRAFAARLADSLETLSVTMPRAPISLSEHAAIRKMREEFTFAAATGEDVAIWQSATGTDWTVICTDDPAFAASCLNRLIFVKPFPPDFATFRIDHLSTAGIWPVSEENAVIAAGLGATRICPVGRMQNPAFTWHQDGEPAIGSLVRWIDFELQ